MSETPGLLYVNHVNIREQLAVGDLVTVHRRFAATPVTGQIKSIVDLPSGEVAFLLPGWTFVVSPPGMEHGTPSIDVVLVCRDWQAS